MCKYGDKTLDSDDEIDEMAMMNALGANDTMFKSASIPIACPWPIHIVSASEFAMTSPEAIRMPPELPHRSFEYGASWVEHYYAGLIKECRKQERMDLVVMLYQWYVAQFTLDYLNDVSPLSSEQFLAASNVISSTECLERLSGDACKIAKACRKLMKMHDDKLDSLPVDISRDISAALQGFYTSVARQCNNDADFESMGLQEYMEYRTLNAGGLLGFIRQIRLLSYLDRDCRPVGEWSVISRLVGLNVALVNDLYGVKKDSISGEPNMILKHASVMQCDLNESVHWAVDCIKDTVTQISIHAELHPGDICTKFNVAMNCVSGNHGFHESSKRYELPRGFSWETNVLFRK